MDADSRTPARILLVDDHPGIRLALRRLLADLADMEVCGEADSVEDALDAVGTLKPDLVIVDLSLRGMHGLELIRRLTALEPRLPVVVFSMFEEEAFAKAAFTAGARAYVMKQDSPRKLVRAIREALTTGRTNGS